MAESAELAGKPEQDSPESCMPSALRLTGPIKRPERKTGWGSWSALADGNATPGLTRASRTVQ